MNPTIAVIRGDGIGPEIMEATLHVLDAMALGLQYEFVDAGLAAYEKDGELLPARTLETIERLGVALKSPLTTPVGEGFSSINVALMLGAGQMLGHLGMEQEARRLRRAIVATMEARDSLTSDLGGGGSTMDFARAIARRTAQ